VQTFNKKKSTLAFATWPRSDLVYIISNIDVEHFKYMANFFKMQIKE